MSQKVAPVEASRVALSDNQRRALNALLKNAGITAAAKEADLNPRTIYRYLKDPVFRAELIKRQDTILASTTTALAGNAEAAVNTLSEILKDKKTTASVKLRVAALILQSLYELVGVQGIAQRVAELERLAEKGQRS